MGILAGILLAAVYVAAVGVFFVFVAPHLLFAGTVLLSFVVPVIHYLSLYRRFRGERRGRVPAVAVGYLMLSIHLNFLALLCHLFLAVLPGLASPLWLGPRLAVVLAVLPDQWLVQAALTGGRADPAPWIQLASVLGKSLLVYALLLLTRGLPGSRLAGSGQPALVQYFFHAAFRDLLAAVRDTYRRGVPLVLLAVRGIVALFRNESVVFTWPLGVTAALVLAGPALTALFMLLCLVLFQGLAVAIAVALVGGIGLLFLLGESFFMWLRWGFAKCPHCYRRVRAPVAQCPACGVKHTHLAPGRYGFLRRRCACDRASLPTLLVLGKTRKLTTYCPHCDQRLSASVYARNLHVPLIGGPTAGKTSLLMSILMELMRGGDRPLRVDFVEETDRRLYRDLWRPAFAAGVPAAKTQEIAPPALTLAVNSPELKADVLYVYDMAGEAVQKQDALGRHRHLEYAVGVMLIVDPFSSGPVRRDYGPALAGADFQYSETAPDGVYDQLVGVLAAGGVLRRGKPCRLPVAVVVPKVDAFDLAARMGVSLADGSFARWAAAGARDSARVRTWLRSHEGNLVRNLESQFRTVRYFAVSAFGTGHRRGRPFRPRHVMQPLLWLLSPHLDARSRAGRRVAGGG